MRAVLRDWDNRPFAELERFASEQGDFAVRAINDAGWADFEAVNTAGETVLAADLTTGESARSELSELEEFLVDLDGSDEAREAVREHIRAATVVVGMQVLMSVYEESVAAANLIVQYLEQRPGVLTQVDTIGWYDGAHLVLSEPE